MIRVALAAVLVLAGGLVWWRQRMPPDTVSIGFTRIRAERAVTPWAKARGLSGRERLGEAEGMLFVYPVPAQHPFWMNGMRFDLDFIFIRGDRVVDLKEKIPAPAGGDPPATVIPGAPADKILEVNAGFIAEHGIKIGDKVKY